MITYVVLGKVRKREGGASHTKSTEYVTMYGYTVPHPTTGNTNNTGKYGDRTVWFPAWHLASNREPQARAPPRLPKKHHLNLILRQTLLLPLGNSPLPQTSTCCSLDLTLYSSLWTPNRFGGILNPNLFSLPQS